MKVLYKKDFLPLQEQEEPQELSYGYVYGTVNGEVISSHNARKSYYGASMNKFMLALVSLIGFDIYGKDHGPGNRSNDRPTGPELKQYLHYSKGSAGSSEMNRALSGQRRKYRLSPKRRADGKYVTSERAAELALNKKQINSVLTNEIGINRSLLPGIRYRSRTNKQTPLGTFEFLSFLVEQAGDKQATYTEEASEILKLMQTPFRGHDSRWFRKTVMPFLNKNGVQINNIYGKGGFNGPNPPIGMNLGVVINNTHILVLYSNDKRVGERKWGRKALNKTILSILSGTPPVSSPGERAPEFQTSRQKSRGFVQVEGNVRDKNRAWGTPAVAACVKRLGDWPIGDISMPKGGKMSGHSSHRVGIDFDAALPIKNGGYSTAAGGRTWTTEKTGKLFRDVSPDELDFERALSFLRTVRGCGAIVFIDKQHIAALKKYATPLFPPDKLKLIFRGIGLARKADTAHRGHFHVRASGRAPRRRIKTGIAARPAPAGHPTSTSPARPTSTFDYDTFYTELDMYFSECMSNENCETSPEEECCGRNIMLPKGGPDRAWGDEHITANLELQKAKKTEVKKYATSYYQRQLQQYLDLGKSLDESLSALEIDQTSKGKHTMLHKREKTNKILEEGRNVNREWYWKALHFIVGRPGEKGRKWNPLPWWYGRTSKYAIKPKTRKYVIRAKDGTKRVIKVTGNMHPLTGKFRPLHGGALTNWRPYLLMRMLEGNCKEDEGCLYEYIKYIDPHHYAKNFSRAVGISAYFAEKCGVAKDPRAGVPADKKCMAIIEMLLLQPDYYPPTFFGPDPHAVALRELKTKLQEVTALQQDKTEAYVSAMKEDPECNGSECQSARESAETADNERVRIQQEIQNRAFEAARDRIKSGVVDEKEEIFVVGPLEMAAPGKMGYRPSTPWIEDQRPLPGVPSSFTKSEWKRMHNLYMKLRVKGESRTDAENKIYNKLVCGMDSAGWGRVCQGLMKAEEEGE